MTCETTRQRLLRAERPDRPPADVQPHLAACGACRSWQRRLTLIEGQVADVPVPASAPPPELLRQLLNGQPPLPGGSAPSGNSPPWWVSATASGQNNGNPPWWVAPAEADRQRPNQTFHRRRPDSSGSPPNDRARRKVAVAFAMTLGLAVFSLCWGLWSHTPPESARRQSLYAARQERFDQRFASARTPKERMGLLADFAGELEREALTSARTGEPDKLRELATLYVQVVSVRLLNAANTLPREEREAVVRDVAERLRHTESEMQHFLMENKSHAGSESLRDMAVAARDVQDRLWAMLRTA